MVGSNVYNIIRLPRAAAMFCISTRATDRNVYTCVMYSCVCVCVCANARDHCVLYSSHSGIKRVYYIYMYVCGYIPPNVVYFVFCVLFFVQIRLNRRRRSSL